MGDVYDSVFRTILNDCRKLIIPIINEVFGESYSGSERIEFFPNEHFIARQNEADQKRVTDTNFTIYGANVKQYHWECQSTPDNRMLIRLFEYDAQIALDQGSIANESLTVTFPHSAVLYLRSGRRMPEKYRYVLNTPGGSVEYDVPVMKMQSYALEEIFDKRLLLLLPFYIFLHERHFKEYDQDVQKLELLEAEYKGIVERLEGLEEKGVIGTFDKRTIMELSGAVLNEIAKKYENIRKGVGGIMSGALLETEARTIKNEGISRGEMLFATLMNKLFADGRTEDAKLAASDEEARKKFYKEYGIID